MESNAVNGAAPVANEETQEITAKLNVAELWEGWAKKIKKQPQCLAHIRFGAKTDMGRVRENNEDKFDFFIPDQPSVLAIKGMLFAVSDGMGGHAAGQIASELSLKVTIKTYFSDGSDDVPKSIRSAVAAANSLVYDTATMVPDRAGMGATLTVAIIREKTMYVAQVGDSRCYLLRDGCLDQITVDHSWVEEQVRRGAMTREEGEMSPFHNLITRSVGTAPQVEVDTYDVALKEGDRILLCSDGLSGMVTDDQIEKVLAEASGPSMAALALTERAFANGGVDNITAVIVFVDGFEECGGEAERRSPLSRLFRRDG